MNTHEKLNYLEFPAIDLQATKKFFELVFGWKFTDFGPEYSAFNNQGLEGGFYQANLSSDSAKGSVLPIFYSDNLEPTLAKIEVAGGKIIKPVYSFPGGRRFHFTEPSGNELAVWSDK